MRRLVATTVAALSIVPIACADAGATPLETVAEAVARTLGTGTARGSFTVTSARPGAEPAVTMFGEGMFDFENRLGSMHITATDLRVPHLTGEFDVVVHGPTQYLSVPPGVPLDRPFVVLDHRALRAVPIDPLAFDLLLSADPSTALRWFRGAGGDVRRAGTDVVREVETTHFVLEVGVARATQQAPDDLADSFGRLAARFGRLWLPAEVWVGNDDQRIRRLSIRFDPSHPAEATEPTVLTVDLFDFGVSVSVGRPGPDQVVSLGAVLDLPPPRRRRR